jgi:vibriolysin
MLTASFPADHRTWFAAGKDHKVSSPASINAWAFAIEDPGDLWDVRIHHVKSAAVDQPQITAILPPGFILTGGGAFVDYHGAGNMLTGSFPHQSSAHVWDGWEARSKDHQISDPSPITAYAIGIRLRSGLPSVGNQVISTLSKNVNHPSATACLGAGFHLTGGGAFDDWHGAGNLLTASAPDLTSDSCWIARGKDLFESSPAVIHAFAIGIASL